MPIRINPQWARELMEEFAEEIVDSAEAVLSRTRAPAVSRPGEPPARRNGNLATNWTIWETDSQVTVFPNADYAAYLEDGTRKMAARPFMDEIAAAAEDNFQPARVNRAPLMVLPLTRRR